LRAVLPASFVVTPDDFGLRLEFQPAGHRIHLAVTNLVDQPGDRIELLQSAAWSALNTVQDFASEALQEPWPSSPGRPRSYMPAAQALIEGDTLRLWYGDAHSATLMLPSIRLGTLAS
jgi:hypothetical protein